MKKYLLIAITLIFYGKLNAQKVYRTLNGSVIENERVFNYQFVKNEGVGYTLSLIPIDSSKAISSAFSEFNKDIFRGVLKAQIQKNDSILFKYYGLDSLKKEGTKFEAFKDFSDKLYYIISTRLQFEDEKPLAAIIALKNSKFSAVIKSHKGSKEILTWTNFNIDKIDVEFEDGTMKNIEVKAFDSLKNSYRFRNITPISISGKFHGDRFHKYFIVYNQNEKKFSVKLSEILSYWPTLNSNTENYAPENSVHTLDPKIGANLIELKKEVTSQLVEVRIFSDLQGIKLGNPQGLVQATLSKKIDIGSRHFPSFIKTNNSKNHNISYLRFVKPEFMLSKIEQKDVNYDFNYKDSLFSHELIRHQFVRFGADINIFKYHIPNAQLNFQLLYNVSWFGSNLKGKEIKVENQTEKKFETDLLFSNFHKTSLQVETKPENRWGASFRWDFWSHQTLLTDKYELNEAKPFRAIAFEGFLKTSPTNKFFFRWAYNYTSKQNYFNQIQIGIQSSLQRYLEDNKK